MIETRDAIQKHIFIKTLNSVGISNDKQFKYICIENIFPGYSKPRN